MSVRALGSRLVAAVMLVSFSGVPLAAGAALSPTLEEQAAALAAAAGRIKARRDEQPGTPLLTDKRIEQIIKDGLWWLLRAQEENGHFRYEYAPYEGRMLSGDNVVRQAGAFYELGEALRYGKGDASALEYAMRRSVGYFEGLSQEATYNETPFRCITEDAQSARCKLGATALVLVGLIMLVEKNPDYRNEYQDLIASYAAYVVAMQKENGGFRSVFDSRRSTQLATESSYSNGEAFLALARLARYRPNAAATRRVDSAFAHVENDMPFDIPLYLWAMAAVADMYRVAPKEEYRAYVKEYTDWRIKGFADRRGTEHNMCAYAEGIVLGYDTIEEFLPAETLRSYRNEIRFWLAKESMLQLGEVDNYRLRSIDPLAFSVLDEPSKAYGGFLTSESVLTERIDFTQHCLNAYLVWNDIRGSGPK